MRCIITPSGLVFQATNTDDFNRVKDIIESNSTFNEIDYKTLSAVIYPEKRVLNIIKKCFTKCKLILFFKQKARLPGLKLFYTGLSSIIPGHFRQIQ